MFRNRIKEAYDSLTPSFKRLAEFILNNELDVAFMTATELAQALGVDAATVVRFSQTLGYSGYRELSHEVQGIVKQDLTAAYAGFPDARNDTDRIKALLENERHNLEIAVAQVTDAAAELLKAIAKAKRVWIVGEASGKHLAAMFAEHLRMAGIKADALDADPAAAATVVWDMGTQDLVIGLGIVGTGRDTAAVLSLAEQKGAKIAAVAVSAVSPPAQVATQVLVCPAGTPIGIPSDASLATMLMVLWQALLARDNKLDDRISAIRDSYAKLLEISVGQQVEIAQAWHEF